MTPRRFRRDMAALGVPIDRCVCGDLGDWGLAEIHPRTDANTAVKWSTVYHASVPHHPDLPFNEPKRQ